MTIKKFTDSICVESFCICLPGPFFTRVSLLRANNRWAVVKYTYISFVGLTDFASSAQKFPSSAGKDINNKCNLN